MKLLLKGDVSKVLINDYDRAVYCAWKCILHDDSLIPFIQSAKLDMEEWALYRDVVDNQDAYTDVELGHAAFYLNRTNISGIIKGGPIGGSSQSGKYKLDARFQKPGIIDKIRSIREKADSIELTSMDAADLIKNRLKSADYESTFIYFDPPYVIKGPLLYKNSFSENDHKQLAEAILDLNMKWLVTYDDCQLVRTLFSSLDVKSLEVKYSAGNTKIGKEIAVLSKQAEAFMEAERG